MGAPAREAALSHLRECWTRDSVYTDPITPPTNGLEGLADAIERFHDRWVGGVLLHTSQVDVHSTFGRFSWLLTLPAPVEVDGIRYGTTLEGFDFIEFTPGLERIARIVGFFGPMVPIGP